jgi:hypothetical protein
MFNEKERKEQLTIMYKAYKSEYLPDKIISQEKLMIEQAKKEAREEFVERLKQEKRYDYRGNKVVDIRNINKLLKEYEVTL